MGSRFLTTFAFLVAVFAAVAPWATVAKVFFVGDRAGWTTGFDYQSWAVGKDFTVGDKLVFRYSKGSHNVFKVNGTEFQNCMVPTNISLKLDSGNDVVTLATPGRKWYICGVADHCKQQLQKLVIEVLPANVVIPSPSPSPAYSSDDAAAAAANDMAAPSPSSNGWQQWSSPPQEVAAPSPSGWQQWSGPAPAAAPKDMTAPPPSSHGWSDPSSGAVVGRPMKTPFFNFN